MRKFKFPKNLILSLLGASLLSLGFSAWVFGSEMSDVIVDVNSSDVVALPSFLTFNRPLSEYDFIIGNKLFVKDGFGYDTAELKFAYDLNVKSARNSGAVINNKITYQVTLMTNVPNVVATQNNERATMYTKCEVSSKNDTIYTVGTNVGFNQIRKNGYFSTTDKFTIDVGTADSQTFNLKYTFQNPVAIRNGKVNFHMRLEQVGE